MYLDLGIYYYVVPLEEREVHVRYANYPNANEEPNMVARCRKRNGCQVIALEMLEDVEAGEELLWDYGDDYLTSDEEE